MVDLMQAEKVLTEVLTLARRKGDDARLYPGMMGGTAFLFVTLPQSTDHPETTITFANTREATPKDLRDRLVSGLVDLPC